MNTLIRTYAHPISSSANSTVMRWRHVTRNFIMTSLDRDRDTAGLYPAGEFISH